MLWTSAHGEAKRRALPRLKGGNKKKTESALDTDRQTDSAAAVDDPREGTGY